MRILSLLLCALAGCANGTSDLDVDGRAPTAIIDGPELIDVDGRVTLSGVRSSTPLQGGMTFEWRVASRPARSRVGMLDNSTAVEASFLVDAPGAYEVLLTVISGGVRSAPARWAARTPGTAPDGPTDGGPGPTPSRPIARITGPTEALPRMRVELAGESSVSSPAPFFEWNLVTAPAGNQIGLSSTGSNAQLTPELEGRYTVSLNVVSGGQRSATVTHTIEVSRPPTPGTGDVQVLAFRVVDVEHSRALDRLVFVAESPPALHLIGLGAPLVHTAIVLPARPTSVSISPSGEQAVVGHDGAITHVDLRAAAVLATHSVSCDVLDVVMMADGWAHAFPRVDQWTQIRSVDLSTGREVLSLGSTYAGTSGRRAGSQLYGANNGISPDDIEHFDTSTGPVTTLRDSPYHGDYPMCGNLWATEDGARLFTRCGNTFRTSEVPGDDMRYAGALPRGWYRHIEHSATRGHIFAVDDAAPFDPSPDAGSRVLVFSDAFLQPEPSIALPRFPGPGMRSFRSFGRWVFLSADAATLIVVMQADADSGAQLDWAVWSTAL